MAEDRNGSASQQARWLLVLLFLLLVLAIIVESVRHPLRDGRIAVYPDGSVRDERNGEAA
jgi:hypothetical protein